jgi:glycosyltransferase involved in cell wall biosynthesis
MKIFFFNRFFFPDSSATSQIVSDLAFDLAAEGYDVHAVASRGSDDEAGREEVRGVTIHRVATAIGGPHGLGRRALAYLDYYRGARKAARDLVKPGDVVVLKTDPPLLSAAVGPIAKTQGARLVIWLQDVFPEVAREFGVPGMGGISGRVIRRIRDKSLSAADRVVVIGEHMAKVVILAGAAPAGKVEVIHNWADGEAIRPIEPDSNALRRRWAFDRKFVVGYSGNLGRVHEFDTIIDAARLLAGDANIQFVVIGRGPRLAEVTSRVKREGLSNVRFEPHQDRSLLSESLGVPDIHLSVLRPGFEGLVHPSKLYGIMAAGRPTIFIGDARAETAAILQSTGSGMVVANGDAAALVRAITSLRADEETRARMGRGARRAFDELYAMPIGFQKWRSVLASLGCRRRGE